MDIYSIKFKGCRYIYPIKIVRPIDRYKYCEKEEIRSVVSNLNERQIILEACIFDNPKRSVAKDTKSHSSTHPCEYCECGAVTYKDNTMSKKKLTWPPSTMNGRPRTITAIRRIVASIEAEEENLSKDYLKGIKGRSVLLDQPNFDFIHDIPTEYMHIVCIGNVKKLIEFTYKTGKKEM